ncbi:MULTISPECIES: hypothetical protein [Aphanizomenonaceae]|uniref:hypothetical protein n=1 Tax=Aphanizomenonaceae TaxID=1892259 RepID=UPI001447DDD4|nr:MULTISPECIES: hypothetical protein [Aphanizomenonaceae]MBD2442334.1 hypothetical protein [Dolichospermum sp. FACHB-1091]MTJ30328.1 hypothetical protein [Aphanizomenon sp. UHCC 0183]
MNRKKSSGDTFGVPNRSGDTFGFSKPRGINGIKSKKNKPISQPSMSASTIELIKQAMNQKRLIEFYYQELHRIAEPHIIGLKNELLQVLVYQIRGESNSMKLPDWRRMNLDDMSCVQIIDETFFNKVLSSSDSHSSWDEILFTLDE